MAKVSCQRNIKEQINTHLDQVDTQTEMLLPVREMCFVEQPRLSKEYSSYSLYIPADRCK